MAVAATFGIGEIVVAGTFFLAPFAVGALAAAIVSFLTAPVWVSWLVFLIVALLAFFALKPLARKLDMDLPNPAGIGANRLVGLDGTVKTAIPVGATGTGEVKIGGESWLAEGREGMGLPEGTHVRVIEVRGTRVIVEPASAAGLDSLG